MWLISLRVNFCKFKLSFLIVIVGQLVHSINEGLYLFYLLFFCFYLLLYLQLTMQPYKVITHIYNSDNKL